MGRPKEHDAKTAAALLDAAERIVQAEGLQALTVRRVAKRGWNDHSRRLQPLRLQGGSRCRARTTGVRDPRRRARLVPQTDDPAADSSRERSPSSAASRSSTHRFFRSLSSGRRRRRSRPASGTPRPRRSQASRHESSGSKRRGCSATEPCGRSCEFDALCEGLAALELRGVLRLHPPAPSRVDDTDDLLRAGEDGEAASGAIEEQIWRDALTALVRGFAVSDAGGVLRELRDPNPLPPT